MYNVNGEQYIHIYVAEKKSMCLGKQIDQIYHIFNHLTQEYCCFYLKDINKIECCFRQKNQNL